MQDKLFTLFGGGGFLGTYVAQRLLNAGARGGRENDGTGRIAD